MKTKALTTAFLIALLAGTGSLNGKDILKDQEEHSVDKDHQPKDAVVTEPEWLVIREVTYLGAYGVQVGMDFEGMDRVYLDSDTFYAVSELGGEEPEGMKPALRWEQEKEWERGRVVEIRYSVQTGAVVYDPETGLYIGIKHGLVDHPLDELFEEKKAEGSTMSVLFASGEMRELWKKEIERLYDALAEGRDAEGRKEVEAAREAWKTFYYLHMLVMREEVDLPGSMGPYYTALEMVQFLRNHAMTLARW